MYRADIKSTTCEIAKQSVDFKFLYLNGDIHQ